MTVTALKPKPKEAFLMYGYVIAVDENGEQLPEYSGAYTDVAEKLKRAGVEIKRRR